MFFCQTNSGFLYYHELSNTYYNNTDVVYSINHPVVLHKRLFELTPELINNIRDQPHFVITDVGFGIANIVNDNYEYIISMPGVEESQIIHEDIPLYIPVFPIVLNEELELMPLRETPIQSPVDWHFVPIDLVKSGNNYYYIYQGDLFDTYTMDRVEPRPEFTRLNFRPTIENSLFKIITNIGQMLISLSNQDGSYQIIDDQAYSQTILRTESLNRPDNFYLINNVHYDNLPNYPGDSDLQLAVTRYLTPNSLLLPSLLTLNTSLIQNDALESPPMSPQQSSLISPSRNPEITDYRIDAIGAYFALIYNIPFKTPEFIILNGLRVNFISFSDIHRIQIVKYELDPYLQIYAGLPLDGRMNRIVTLFGSNGLTYLIKAKYDPISQQIFEPI